MRRDSQKPTQKGRLFTAALLASLLVVILVAWRIGLRSLVSNVCSNQARLTAALNPGGQAPGTDGQNNAAPVTAEEAAYVSSIWEGKVRQEKLTGQIAAIDRSAGVANGFPYQVRLSIKLSNIGSADYYFSESDLGKLTIAKIVGGKEQPMTLTELRQGDRVVVDTKSDLLKGAESNLLEFKITKM